MVISNVGINDMPSGWRLKNDKNKRIYTCWSDMIRRCYSEKSLKKNPSYKDCFVCERWLLLSNFVEDIEKIDGYENWLNNPNKRIALDKDIKTNGKNKCYCLENCMFVSQVENTKQSNKTMSRDYMKGENNCWHGKNLSEEHIAKRKETVLKNETFKGVNNPRALKVAQCDENWNIIKIWDYIKEASIELDICYTSIIGCCKGKQKSTKTKDGTKYKWKYINKEEVIKW